MRIVTASEIQSGNPTLIDVREYPEYAAGFIRRAQLVPLSQVAGRASTWTKSTSFVMICKSGRRARRAAEDLEAMGFSNVSVLDGGVDAWREQGRPLQTATRRPWALERQVRIAAGTLVVTFSVLGLVVSPILLMGATLVGAGLIFAGVSNTCMMGSLLGKMPWNRADHDSSSCNL
jgi:rhodanese-related sulfurtransferase